MNVLLMAAMFAAAPVDQPASRAAEAAAPNVDGKWLIVYAEENSRRVQNWEQRVATLKDGVLTYERDGKETAINLTFGPHQTLKASPGVAAGDKDNASGGGSGVYIAAQDHLCISLASGSYTGGEKPKEDSKEKDVKASDSPKGQSSGVFILILKRQR